MSFRAFTCGCSRRTWKGETDLPEVAREVFEESVTPELQEIEAAMRKVAEADMMSSPYGTGRCVLGAEMNTRIKLPPTLRRRYDPAQAAGGNAPKRAPDSGGEYLTQAS